MKDFEHINAETIDGAVAALVDDSAKPIAGGTDLLGLMKLNILPEYPATLVNIKSILGLDYIKEEGGILKIGAMTRLSDIAENATVKNKYRALAQAAQKVGTPQLRNLGTIAGNICQYVRCWYFRGTQNRFHCLRKGGNLCYALAGENSESSIFGAVSGCVAVNPSDTAPALVVLNANIVTSKRTINCEDFWSVNGLSSTILDQDEIVTEIQIPEPASGSKSAFVKFAIRQSLDFSIVNCAAAIGGGDARICLNAVYNMPKRATGAEDFIKGKAFTEANAEAAGAEAVKGTTALTMNKYKIQIAKTLVKRAILACA